MPCDPEELKHVPLFELLDEEEIAVLASQVDIQRFAARERIFKIGDPPKSAYVLMSGAVRVSTFDEDQQEVVIDEPAHGGFFGLASMLDETPHQATAMALEATECLELSRNDIEVLVQQKPMAGLDMLTTLGRQLHASQRLIRLRAEPQSEPGDRAGSHVGRARCGFGSAVRRLVEFHYYFHGRFDGLYHCEHRFERASLGPVSVYSAQPFSIHVGGIASAGDHDEPEPPGYEGPAPQRTGF